MDGQDILKTQGIIVFKSVTDSEISLILRIGRGQALGTAGFVGHAGAPQGAGEAALGRKSGDRPALTLMLIT